MTRWWQTHCCPVCGWHIDEVLLTAQQIVVHEASVNLLQKELDDQQHSNT